MNTVHKLDDIIEHLEKQSFSKTTLGEKSKDFLPIEPSISSKEETLAKIIFSQSENIIEPSLTKSEKLLLNYTKYSLIEPNSERYDDLNYNEIDIIKTLSMLNDRYYNFMLVEQDDIKKYDKNMDIKLINNIKTFNDIKKYMINFLDNKAPYGIIYHNGPLAKETLLITDYLKSFYEYDFITLDSQPGIYINENEYVQKPYLRLASSKEKIQKLLKLVLEHNFWSRVGYNKDTNYIRLEDELNIDLYSVMIGTRYQNPNETIYEYYNMILSNKFFIELLELTKI